MNSGQGYKQYPGNLSVTVDGTLIQNNKNINKEFGMDDPRFAKTDGFQFVTQNLYSVTNNNLMPQKQQNYNNFNNSLSPNKNRFEKTNYNNNNNYNHNFNHSNKKKKKKKNRNKHKNKNQKSKKRRNEDKKETNESSDGSESESSHSHSHSLSQNKEGWNEYNQSTFLKKQVSPQKNTNERFDLPLLNSKNTFKSNGIGLTKQDTLIANDDRGINNEALKENLKENSKEISNEKQAPKPKYNHVQQLMMQSMSDYLCFFVFACLGFVCVCVCFCVSVLFTMSTKKYTNK